MRLTASGIVEFLVCARSRRKLPVKRLAVPDTASHEFGPSRDLWLGICALGEEPPELGVMPAKIVSGAVPVLPDTFSQAQYLLDQLLVGQRLESIIGCHHAESLSRHSCPPCPTRRSIRAPNIRTERQPSIAGSRSERHVRVGG